jgi:hypothetical protein
MVDMKNIEGPGSAEFLHLTDRFSHAIDYARQVHVNYRKGTSVPYMAHLLGVAGDVHCDHCPDIEDDPDGRGMLPWCRGRKSSDSFLQGNPL